MSVLVDTLRARIEPHGFDLIAPLQVGWYNAQVDHAYRLPDFGEPTSLAVVVANTRALWSRFLAAVRERPALQDDANPLDAYTVDVIAAAVASLEVRAEVRYAYEPPPRRVAMQRLAHVAGLAYLSPSYLCIHETYGPWIGLRAAIVFDAPGPAAPLNTPAPPCECTNNCKPALERALASNTWRDWLDVREACPAGRAHRYDDDQIEYHYTKARHLLR